MANRFRWLSLAVACVPAVLAAAACGGDTEEPGGGGTGGSAGSAAGDAGVGRGGSSTGGSGGTGGTAGVTRPADAGTPRVTCGDAGVMCPPNGNNNRDSILCDAPRNRCVECFGESDCVNQMGANGAQGEIHCNIETGRCRQCVPNNAALGCPAGQACQTNGSCVPTCASDADCAANMQNRACSPTTSTCTECLTDTHCATNANQPACNVAEQECAECNTNAHCAMRMNAATQPLCNTMTHDCEQCLVDTDCATAAGTPFCRAQSNTCVACRTVADCPAGATGCTTGNNPGRCQFPPDGGTMTATDAARPPTQDARAEAEAATPAPRDASVVDVRVPVAVDAAGQ